MKAGFIISLFFYIPMIAFAIHDDASNIVIENLTEHVRLIPDKTGTALKEIKHSTQYTFRAKHSAGNAIATTYYDDDISIDKATGGDVSYKPFIINVFYSDSKICIVKASLPKKGATAKASFKRTFTKPEYFCRLSVGEKYHIERAVLKFEIPDCLAGRYTLKPQNMPDSMYSVEKVQEKDRLIVTYYLKGQKKLTPSSDSPPVSATIPQINLLGHFSDVDCLYRYLLSYIPADDPGTRYVADKAAEVTADCRDDNEKIKAVNDFVHANIRYLAVVHGESGQRPDPASEVLRKRFGDCKGSAILTRDMLRAVGIDARLVWIGTRDIGTDWTDIPNISSGNHMISAVMLPGDSIMFLDGTSTYSTPGNQPYGITGCQAMIEDTPDRCIIRRVPHTLPGHNLRDEHLTLTLDGNHLSAQGTVSLTGAFYRQARSAADDIIPGLRQEFYEHIFCNTMPGARPVEISCTVTADSMLVTGTATMPAAVKDAGVNSYVDTKIASRLDNFSR